MSFVGIYIKKSNKKYLDREGGFFAKDRNQMSKKYYPNQKIRHKLTPENPKTIS
ncbi:hypothetical protein [Lonepinella koalarum]|uniref:hypothetical protein n=1 Tax=Lonepinella koalarum TaxID=53417 RepID=UPI003F6E34CF